MLSSLINRYESHIYITKAVANNPGKTWPLTANLSAAREAFSFVCTSFIDNVNLAVQFMNTFLF